MTASPYDWFERQLVTLERKYEELRQDFHDHAEQPVHAGFVGVLQQIEKNLEVLQARWIQVGGAVIALLLAILLSLLGVLWAMLNEPPPPPAITQFVQRPNCPAFVSQAHAQEFFRNNPTARYLDTDNDGIACESNPPPFDMGVVNP